MDEPNPAFEPSKSERWQEEPRASPPPMLRQTVEHSTSPIQKSRVRSKPGFVSYQAGEPWLKGLDKKLGLNWALEYSKKLRSLLVSPAARFPEA